MKAAIVAAGWLLPGGGYLLTRRFLQFGLFFVLISGAFGAGIAFHGGNLWPRPDELQGLDGFAVIVAQAGAMAKGLAGGPYLLARFLGDAQSYSQGRLHEYGTTLLTVAGLLNLLALVDAQKR